MMAKGRVLVVDDEAFIREMVNDFLESDAIACDSAATLTAALENLAGNTYDLVLLDRNLDFSHGDDAVSCIRRIHPNVPVVIMTGDHQFGDTSIKRVGANGFIHKPFKYDEFMQTILQFLEPE